MRVVEKVPKSAKFFVETDNIALYATRKRAYIIFKNVGKFVNGKFVELPEKKKVLRLTPEEYGEFIFAVDNVFRRLELIEGKYVDRYIV